MLVKSLVKAAFRGEPLFRPSRPDFIETLAPSPCEMATTNCSGLLGRTSLRLGDREFVLRILRIVPAF